jgi:hypothetical protein
MQKKEKIATPCFKCGKKRYLTKAFYERAMKGRLWCKSCKDAHRRALKKQSEKLEENNAMTPEMIQMQKDFLAKKGKQ